jgi:hypothetical protein
MPRHDPGPRLRARYHVLHPQGEVIGRDGQALAAHTGFDLQRNRFKIPAKACEEHPAIESTIRSLTVVVVLGEDAMAVVDSTPRSSESRADFGSGSHLSPFPTLLSAGSSAAFLTNASSAGRETLSSVPILVDGIVPLATSSYALLLEQPISSPISLTR